jgi:hypothetical protein
LLVDGARRTPCDDIVCNCKQTADENRRMQGNDGVKQLFSWAFLSCIAPANLNPNAEPSVQSIECHSNHVRARRKVHADPKQKDRLLSALGLSSVCSLGQSRANNPTQTNDGHRQAQQSASKEVLTSCSSLCSARPSLLMPAR